MKKKNKFSVACLSLFMLLGITENTSEGVKEVTNRIYNVDRKDSYVTGISTSATKPTIDISDTGTATASDSSTKWSLINYASTYTWTSSNPSIVSLLSSSGTSVTYQANRRGTAYLTCTCTNKKATSTSKIKISVKPKFTCESNIYLDVNHDPFYTIVPVGDSINGPTTYKYVCHNPSIATVDNYGNVEALKEGSTYVMVYGYYDGVSYSVKVNINVSAFPTNPIEENEVTLYAPESTYLTIYRGEEFRYVSTNSSVASIDNRGQIIAHYNGDCEIRAYFKDKIVDSCKVHVISHRNIIITNKNRAPSFWGTNTSFDLEFSCLESQEPFVCESTNPACAVVDNNKTIRCINESEEAIYIKIRRITDDAVCDTLVIDCISSSDTIIDASSAENGYAARQYKYIDNKQQLKVYGKYFKGIILEMAHKQEVILDIRRDFNEDLNLSQSEIVAMREKSECFQTKIQIYSFTPYKKCYSFTFHYNDLDIINEQYKFTLYQGEYFIEVETIFGNVEDSCVYATRKDVNLLYNFTFSKDNNAIYKNIDICPNGDDSSVINQYKYLIWKCDYDVTAFYDLLDFDYQYNHYDWKRFYFTKGIIKNIEKNVLFPAFSLYLFDLKSDEIEEIKREFKDLSEYIHKFSNEVDECVNNFYREKEEFEHNVLIVKQVVSLIVSIISFGFGHIDFGTGSLLVESIISQGLSDILSLIGDDALYLSFANKQLSIHETEQLLLKLEYIVHEYDNAIQKLLGAVQNVRGNNPSLKIDFAYVVSQEEMHGIKETKITFECLNLYYNNEIRNDDGTYSNIIRDTYSCESLYLDNSKEKDVLIANKEYYLNDYYYDSNGYFKEISVGSIESDLNNIAGDYKQYIN